MVERESPSDIANALCLTRGWRLANESSLTKMESMSASTIAANDIYAALFQRVSGHITDYRKDLEVHDHDLILANPGTPFLHWTRPTGTNIEFLFNPDADAFPPKGKTVPYLFGQVNRVELSHKPFEVAEYFQRQEAIIVHHFDGQRLRPVSLEAAVEITLNYSRQVQGVWHQREHRT